MTDNRWHEQVLEWMPLGRRKKGTLRVSWMNAMQREREVDEGQWMDRE
jgi:hypothetical protein